MYVDPSSGEIVEPACAGGDRASERPQVVRLPSSGGTTLDELMEALSEHTDALDAALAEEEKAELAYLFAESVALVEYEGKVPATILNKYAQAIAKNERAAYVSARQNRIRADKQVRKDEHLMMGEQSNMKHKGRV